MLSLKRERRLEDLAANRTRARRDGGPCTQRDQHARLLPPRRTTADKSKENERGKEESVARRRTKTTKALLTASRAGYCVTPDKIQRIPTHLPFGRHFELGDDHGENNVVRRGFEFDPRHGIIGIVNERAS